MKISALAQSGLLALALVMGGAMAARADVITLDVSASMSPSGGASCLCTLGGDIVIDNSAGTIISEDVTMAGESPAAGPFTRNGGIYPDGALVDLVIRDSSGNDLSLEFSTPTPDSLVGYTGGSLSAHTLIATDISYTFWDLTSGSLTAQAQTSVPEPSSLALLLSALAGLGGLLGGRRLARRAAPG